jgi:hypothetical protein
MHEMPETLATVTAYRRREHAGVAQRALDGAGIDSVVEETEVAKLRVDRLDALYAGEVLNRVDAPLEEIDEADEVRGNEACPACHSRNVEASRRWQLFLVIAVAVIGTAIAVGRTDAAFFILFATGVYLLTANRWRCSDCGERWD